MNPDRRELEQNFRSLADDELTQRVASGTLTELARWVAIAELKARKLQIPALDSGAGKADDAYHGDMTIVVRNLDAIEAHMLCSCLRAAGVPADSGDTNLVQMHSLLTIAVGGACVRVPENYLAEANEIIDAFKSGAFQLDEDFDFHAGES
ncbi:MAG: DUF2007 domain-containing protein [Sulfuritalea sp.]|nr:DUF2007 domain-containing protein [Sulfuritalea sp.]